MVNCVKPGHKPKAIKPTMAFTLRVEQITKLSEAKKLLIEQRSEILRLQAELAIAQEKKAGIRSDGIKDAYSDMSSKELRNIIIKRDGDPDEIVEGFHSRQRSIKMREWIRAHPAKTKKRKM